MTSGGGSPASSVSEPGCGIACRPVTGPPSSANSPESTGTPHVAPSTPGDFLFHIRADRQDLCFEFERRLLDALGDSVTVIDDTPGFRYFDTRDLLGFVDGTANPIEAELPEMTLIGDEDPEFAGGSYVIVQKYLHDLAAWGRLTTEEQEAVIGRTKADNVELDDAAGPQLAHKTLTTISDGDGGEFDILRDNMPFGRPGRGEFGTYFIGYSRRLWVTELMIQRMFVGQPPGLLRPHPRRLDRGHRHDVLRAVEPGASGAGRPGRRLPTRCLLGCRSGHRSDIAADSLGIGSLRPTAPTPSKVD